MKPKSLLVLLTILFCCTQIQAQNIEGQIVASQYGTWKIQGYSPNTYSFSPSSCNAAGPNGQLAFTVGTPIRIVDGNPNLSETVTPTVVTTNNQTCAVSIAPVNAHSLPFYLTSATGGLQEAINQNLTQPATNTIILSNEWYQLVSAAGGSTVSVIAAAAGSISLGLSDVTQTPTQFYIWSGGHYTAVSFGGGGVCPAGVCNSNGLSYGASYQVGTAPNALLQLNGSAQLPAVSAALLTNFPTLNQSTTGNAGSATVLAGASALPNGTTCTTQSPGDNTLKCATTAFVQAAVSSAGGGSVTNFTFPANLGALFACSVANATTTPTVTCTVSNAAANSVFGNFTGIAAAPGFSASPIFSGAGLTALNASNITSGTIASARLPAIAVPQGGTGLGAIALNQTPVGSGTNTYTAATLPSCSGPGQALTYNNSTQTYICGTFTVTICHGNWPVSGSVFTVNTATVATIPCSGAVNGDTVVITPHTNIFTIGGFQPSTNGILALSPVISANTITINASNNTAVNYSIGAGMTVDYSVTR